MNRKKRFSLFSFNKLPERMKSDSGWGAFLGAMGLIALIFFFVITVTVLTGEKDVSVMQEEITKEENLYISNFFEDEVVTDIVKNEIEGVNWNRRVDFIDGKSAYVQISCKISNQIEKGSSEDGAEREYKCKLVEIGSYES